MTDRKTVIGRMNIHRRADRQTDRQTDNLSDTINLVDGRREMRMNKLCLLTSFTLAYGSYDIFLVHVYHIHMHVFLCYL